MKQSWDDYERAGERGPLALVVKVVLGCAVAAALIAVISFGFGLVGGSAEVAQQEFGAKAQLRKYEWFKDAASQLQKKLADIQVYEARRRSLLESYSGTPRRQWARVDQEAFNLADAELAGIKASYNALAADYNSASSKFNWQPFAGDLPQAFQPMVTQ